jgi:hypothetical protein
MINSKKSTTRDAARNKMKTMDNQRIEVQDRRMKTNKNKHAIVYVGLQISLNKRMQIIFLSQINLISFV